MNSPLAAIEKKMNIILVFGILLFSIAIIETVLSGTWNRFYFLYGIPIYSKEIEISDLTKTSQLVIHFIDTMDTVKGLSKYKGKRLDENTFAFRKKMIAVSFFRNDFENIHGTIGIDSESRTLKIKGYAGYTFPALMLYIFIVFTAGFESFLTEAFSSLIIILILSSISYAFDRRKYNKLFTEITKLINGYDSSLNMTYT